MKIRPLGDRLLVKREEPSETVRGGIISPDSAKEKPQEGKVVAVGKGRLDAKTREAIALTVAGENGCNYCASAHTAVGARLGVPSDELRANLEGQSGDAKLAAILRFARAVVVKRGWIGDADLAEARAAGLDDGRITEIVAAVAANIFSNYVNHVARTEVDFPLVQTGRSQAA